MASPSLGTPKRVGTRKEDTKSHHAPNAQPVPSVPAGRPSTATDATARAKPRHSKDPVIVQNRQHRRRRVVTPADAVRQRYAASLLLPPISGPQHGPLPPICTLTGAFRYRPRPGAALTDSLVSPPALDARHPCLAEEHNWPHRADLENDRRSRGTAGPSSASRPTATTPSGHRSTGHSLTPESLSSLQEDPTRSEQSPSRSLSALASAACMVHTARTLSPVERTSSSSSRAHARWHPYHTAKVSPCLGAVHSKDL
ncbi:hypothetical protein FOMPIDRAFT_159435 [Fomitopsis schrenkii]|uniref:Uncharacterized protein n=1 Tax=Fomitopsis schrenkii TaxID=2126942 RepID=S8FI92_FOMSC|nr:hypothetical protein FOMPIDRAFT_159435 [Fomitopsis schrenkii]